MEPKRAIEIIQHLADGINPYTGEVMDSESVFQHPDTVRALFTALEQLKKADTRKRNNDNLPEQAWKLWTAEEEASLIQEYDSGMDVASIAVKHSRTEFAIQSRLLKLNKIHI